MKFQNQPKTVFNETQYDHVMQFGDGRHIWFYALLIRAMVV